MPQPSSEIASTAQPFAWLVWICTWPVLETASRALKIKLVATLSICSWSKKNFRQRLEIFFQIDAGGFLPASQRFGDQFVEIRFDGLDLQFVADGAEPADEPVDVRDGFAHAAQRVRPERRVVEMHGQILEHQVQRVRGVL